MRPSIARVYIRSVIEYPFACSVVFRPPVPPAPCQVTSQVIVAVAWKAPPGCPALELV
jgi:hypothetical protein